MLEKRYHYSEKGQARAEDTGLHDALSELKTNITQELDANNLRPLRENPVQELAEETVASEFFQELSDSEQREVLRAINRFVEGDVDTLTWLVEGERSDSNLLGLPEAESKPRAAQEDLVTLIGTRALDFYGAEQKSWLDNWEKNGFKGKLDAAIFATAASIDNMERCTEEPDESFGYSVSYNTYRNILLGASMHGDFRITQYDTHPHGPISPTGRKVEFAPNGKEIIMYAQHSMEPLIAMQTLNHLYRIHNNEGEIESLLEAVNGQIEKDDSQAETVDSDDHEDRDTKMFVYTLQNIKEQWRGGTMTVKKDGIVLERFIAHPGNRNTWLKILSFPECLRFAQVNYTDEGGEWDSQYIDIPNEHLADFLAALHGQTKRSTGLTSPNAIETLLQAAAPDG